MKKKVDIINATATTVGHDCHAVTAFQFNQGNFHQLIHPDAHSIYFLFTGNQKK